MSNIYYLTVLLMIGIILLYKIIISVDSKE